MKQNRLVIGWAVDAAAAHDRTDPSWEPNVNQADIAQFFEYPAGLVAKPPIREAPPHRQGHVPTSNGQLPAECEYG